MSEGASGNAASYWEAVVGRHYRPLLNYGLRLADGNMDDACDLVQEAFCRVLDSGHAPDAAEAEVYYMRTTMRRILFDRRKKECVITDKQEEEIDKQKEGQAAAAGEKKKKKKKEYRPRYVSYDDEQNQGLQNQLVEKAGEVMQSRLEVEQLLQGLRQSAGPLTEREQTLYDMHYIRGLSNREIAEELGEDVRVIKCDVNALKAKVRARVLKNFPEATRNKIKD